VPICFGARLAPEKLNCKAKNSHPLAKKPAFRVKIVLSKPPSLNGGFFY
jgi:hypothetical protein